MSLRNREMTLDLVALDKTSTLGEAVKYTVQNTV